VAATEPFPRPDTLQVLALLRNELRGTITVMGPDATEEKPPPTTMVPAGQVATAVVTGEPGLENGPVAVAVRTGPRAGFLAFFFAAAGAAADRASSTQPANIKMRRVNTVGRPYGHG
jgi:hypothetical protein